MSSNNQKTIEKIENGRAAYAFDEVKKFVDKNGTGSTEFRSYVKKMPAMIQVNGLGQTLAFCFSKGNEYMDIYNIISKWLAIQLPDIIEGNKEFIEAVINLNSKEYKVVTLETLSLLNWMRRFADGMISTK